MRTSTSLLTILILTILFSLLTFSTAYAGSVSQIKGNKVLLLLDEDSAQTGQEFYVLDSNGKRVALIKISQVKGNRAVGEILKGSASVGNSLQAKTKAAAKAKTNEEPELPLHLTTKRKQLSGGFLAGYAMNTMKTIVLHPTNSAVKEEVNLSGTSFSMKAFADYDFSPNWTARLATGYETFSATGNTQAAICANGTSTNCTVSIDYLALEGALHYNLMTGNTRVWIGAGYAFLLQIAKNIDVPGLSLKGGQAQSVLLSLGTDIGLSGGSFVPLVVEYGIFPDSGSNTTVNAIYARVGYGFNF